MTEDVSLHPSNERLAELRKCMRDSNIDIFLIYTGDPHLSEYVSPADKAREYFSCFTGSNGSMAVSQDEAYLWTDGRYFIQAERELRDSRISLMKSGTPGTPSLPEKLCMLSSEGMTVSADLRTMSYTEYENLRKVLPLSIKLNDGSLVLDKAWSGRPARDFTRVRYLPEDISGESIASKLDHIRANLKGKYINKNDGYNYIVSDLCSVMWIYNLRASDVAYVPVAFSYTVIRESDALLYISCRNLSEEIIDILSDNNVHVKEYEQFEADLPNYMNDGYVNIFDKSHSNAYIGKMLSASEHICCDDDQIIRKYIKNSTEVDAFVKYHIEDGLIMTRFIKYIKEAVRTGRLTEYDAMKYLDEMRLKNEECISLSFETISGYGPNGAVIHYSVDKDSAAEIKDRGFLLVDSGGHYPSCTTDVTRTIALGELTDEERKHYTAVLKGNLDLMDAIFSEGTSAFNLDVLARRPVWDIGEDYLHGTGHGIGACLSVHEGPVSIRSKSIPKQPVLEPGIVLSDEPGIYIEGSHGVRLENELLVVKKGTTSYGNLLGFRCLTVVPFDKEAIDHTMLTEREKEILNNYHQFVFETLSPFMTKEESLWLENECCMNSLWGCEQ